MRPPAPQRTGGIGRKFLDIIPQTHAGVFRNLEALQRRDRWACYKIQGNPPKVDLYLATAVTIPMGNDGPGSPFADAQAALARGDRRFRSADGSAISVGAFSGLAYLPSAADPFVGVFMRPRFPSGEGEMIVDGLSSYTECSRLGTLVICRGALPQGRRIFGKLEFVDVTGFIPLTGHRLREFQTIQERQDQLATIYQELVEAGQ